jgi:hypothetical protein
MGYLAKKSLNSKEDVIAKAIGLIYLLLAWLALEVFRRGFIEYATAMPVIVYLCIVALYCIFMAELVKLAYAMKKQLFIGLIAFSSIFLIVIISVFFG